MRDVSNWQIFSASLNQDSKICSGLKWNQFSDWKKKKKKGVWVKFLLNISPVPDFHRDFNLGLQKFINKHDILSDYNRGALIWKCCSGVVYSLVSSCSHVSASITSQTSLLWGAAARWAPCHPHGGKTIHPSWYGHTAEPKRQWDASKLHSWRVFWVFVKNTSIFCWTALLTSP